MTLTSSSAYSTSTLTDFYSLPELITFTRPLLFLIFLLVVVKFSVRLRVSSNASGQKENRSLYRVFFIYMQCNVK